MAAADILRAAKSFGSGVSAASSLFVTLDIAGLGIQNGDQLAIAIELREPPSTLTGWRAPAGWSLILNPTQNSGSAYIYIAKYGTDVTGTSWTWDNGAGNATNTRWSASFIALKGAAAGPLLASRAAKIAASASFATGDLVTMGDAHIVGFVGARTDGGVSWTWPSGWVEEAEDAVQTATNSTSSGVALYNTTPAATGTYSATATASAAATNGFAALLAFQGISAGGASGNTQAPWTVTAQASGYSSTEERLEGGAANSAVTSALAPFFSTVDADFTFVDSPTPAQGARAARLDVAASTLRMMTRLHGAPVSKRFYRFYMRMPTYPGNANGIVNLRTSSTVMANIRAGSSGALTLRDGSTTRYTSPAMPVDEWFRVEVMIDSVAMKIRLRAFTGTNVHGTVPDIDSGDQTLTTGGTDRFTLGCDNGAAGPWSVLYDAVAESSANWVGPTTVSPNANPVFEWSEGFEGGVEGAEILAADTQFSAVDPNWTYAKFPRPARGGLAARLTVAADETSMLRRTRAAAPLYFFRYYLFLPTFPGSSNGITFLKAGSTSLLTLRATPAGQISLRDASTTRWTSTALPKNQWIRVEGKVDSANHKTQVKLFTGTNLHGLLPNQDSGAQTLTNSNPSSITFGCDNGSVGEWTLLFDEIAESVFDWVGPAADGIPQANAVYADWVVGVSSQGQFGLPSTAALLARSSKTTPNATFTTKQTYAPAPKTTFDLRGSRYEGYFFADAIFGFGAFAGDTATPHQKNNVPFEIATKATPASEVAIVGGVVVGDQDPTITWEQSKHGSPVQNALDSGMDPAEVYSTVLIGNQNQDGDPRIHVANGSWAVIDGLRVDNTHDGFGLYGQAESIAVDTGKVWFRNMWVRRCHDNSIENDVSYLAIDVDDCLFEDVFSLISVRSGTTTGVPDINKTQRVSNSIVSLWPLKGPHKQPSSVVKHGHFYKMQTNSPGLVMRDTILAGTDFAVSSNAQLPERPGLDSYSNVTIVWLGSGKYPGNVPSGCNLTTDATVLSKAIAKWKQRHGVTSFDTVDMAKMIAPTPRSPILVGRSEPRPLVGNAPATKILLGTDQLWP